MINHSYSSVVCDHPCLKYIVSLDECQVGGIGFFLISRAIAYEICGFLFYFILLDCMDSTLWVL